MARCWTHGGIGSWAALVALSGCAGIDDSQLNPIPLIEADAGTQDAGRDSATRDAAVPDSGPDDGSAGSDASPDAAEPTECRPNPDALDEVCPMICPERCNGQDDDCDSRVDEGPGPAACVGEHASGGCVQGQCAIADCDEGYLDCDEDALNGCEAKADSPQNCGGCNRVCQALAQTQDASCSEALECVFETCSEGFASCDGETATGCETSLRTADNCGGCANAGMNERCADLPNVSDSSCDTGSCRIDGCDPGYEDCNFDKTDGCEWDSITDGCCPSSPDRDEDGTPDCLDGCITDAQKTDPGLCGCGVADDPTDSDGDGTPDCTDLCPYDANETAECLWQRLRIDHTFVDAPLSDFPVLVKFAGEVDFSSGRADGGDLFFLAADGQTRLEHEIERFDRDSNELFAHVRFPQVADDVDTVFFLRYGDGTDRRGQNDPTAVWSNGYEGVWHLSSGETDSSGAGIDGTNAGSIEVAGQIHLARGFGFGVRIAMGEGQLPEAGSYTLSAWVRHTEGGDANHDVICNVAAIPDPIEGVCLILRGSDGAVGSYIYPNYLYSGSDRAAAGQWALVSVRITTALGGRFESSVNGSPYETFYTGDTRTTRNTPSGVLAIGRYGGAAIDGFEGRIDEVRVASTSRSNAWIRATYESQRTGSSFVRTD